MKILIAAKGNNLESEIHSRYGHADYYLIVDSSDTEKFESMQMNLESLEDHGISKFKELGITHAIAGNFGTFAFNDVVGGGIKPFICRKMSAREAIQKVINGEVPELKEPTVIKHSHDHNGHHH